MDEADPFQLSYKRSLNQRICTLKTMKKNTNKIFKKKKLIKGLDLLGKFVNQLFAKENKGFWLK